MKRRENRGADDRWPSGGTTAGGLEPAPSRRSLT
jgi:hypothetical protein